MGLVGQWLSDMRESYREEPLVNDVRVGVFYTAVEISTGDVGVAFTPRGLTDTVCCPKSAAGAPPAGRLMDQKAWDIARYALAPGALRRAVGIAALNALCAAAVGQLGLPEGVLRVELDALDAVEAVPEDEVVMVGAFTPFIKRLKGRVASLGVVDKHRDALKGEERALWVPAGRVAQALSSASVVIFSGSILVEGGVEELLSLAKAARVRALAGPTTPLWPRPFFERGIGILGGIRARDGKDLLTIVGQGGSGYLFERAAHKACVVSSSIKSSIRRRAPCADAAR